MAEIKIEKKQPVWPWILGLLVVAALIYLLFFNDSTAVIDNINTTNDTIVDRNELQDNTDLDENFSDVAAFVTFIKNDDGKMTLDHDYSHSTLTKLIDATEEVALLNDFDAKVDFDKARQLADEITTNPEVGNHADFIKEATSRISTVLQNLQAANFPDLKAEADQAKMTSDAINVQELALNQKESIKGFYDAAADLLEKMNN
jgi:hypothetical protein